MARSRTSPTGQPSKLVSKQGWARLAIHQVTLPSGARVKLRIPDLLALGARDILPQHLRLEVIAKLFEQPATENGAAPDTAPMPTIDPEKLARVDELNRWLVAYMVLEPELSEEDLLPAEQGGLGIPEEDKQMLVEIGMRERTEDAAGVRLGVVRLSDWASFRDHHKCEPDCDACQAFVVARSTTGADEV